MCSAGLECCCSCSKCNGMELLRYMLYTCPNLWRRSCSNCYGMDCFSTYYFYTHVQNCDNFRVQSVTELTASVYFPQVQTCGRYAMLTFFLSFMFEIAHCYVIWHLLLRVCVVDASSCWLLFVIHVWDATRVRCESCVICVWDHTRSLVRYLSFASTCTRGWCYATLTSFHHSCLRSHALTVAPCVFCFYVYAWLMLCHVDFSLSFMFERHVSFSCMCAYGSPSQMEKFQKMEITCKKLWNQRCWQC